MTHNFQGLQYACEGCPVVTVLDADLVALSEQQLRNTREARAAAAVAMNHMGNLQELEHMAGHIDCQNIPKNLPAPPDPMPPLGSPERIAYGRLCPAYRAIKLMQKSGEN